ncbi:MAG: hypothetical protein Q4B54_13345 [Coriobacteriales bacterium]|nr:hypothetical protein [Coriobacteriales bacterium]
MSRLTICDRCGRAIAGEPYVVAVTHKRKNRGAPTIDEQRRCGRKELCVECADKQAVFLDGGTIGRVP